MLKLGFQSLLQLFFCAWNMLIRHFHLSRMLHVCILKLSRKTPTPWRNVDNKHHEQDLSS